MSALQESCKCINGRRKYLLRGMHVFVGDCLKIPVRLVVVKGWGVGGGGWRGEVGRRGLLCFCGPVLPFTGKCFLLPPCLSWTGVKAACYQARVLHVYRFRVTVSKGCCENGITRRIANISFNKKSMASAQLRK